MNDIASKGMVRSGTRVSFLFNDLVLIGPISSHARLKIGRNFPLARVLGGGHLGMADPDSVQARIYRPLSD